METISLKLENEFAREIERVMKKNNYVTKTEFIREAMREKVENLERGYLVKEFLKFRGKAKKSVSDEEMHKARELAFEEIGKRFNQ